MSTRSIEDILHFRSDISPFLVHLTRAAGQRSAREVLEAILNDQRLVAGSSLVSDARFGAPMDVEDQDRLFRAICFSETPLAEVHCLLDISYRRVHLEPYGLAFVKKRLAARGVAPALYLNNSLGDQDGVVQALCGLAGSNLAVAERLVPLVAFFGQRLAPVGGSPVGTSMIDFTWEREWRYPACRGDLSFVAEDAFIGFCPHCEIAHFESVWPDVQFVDPRRTLRWYATKLIDARQRLGLRDSVV
ncbi:MAG: hypothetical protein U0167_14305 [bacterium]